MLVAGALAAPASLSSAEWAWAGYACRRAVVPADVPAGAGACHLRFAHFGSLRPDGADVRIVNSAGRRVPHEILRLGPGGQVELLFEAAQLRTSDRFSVYFGNPRAAPPERWEAQSGVVLEVRRKGAGSGDSWAQFQDLFRNSTGVLGRGLRSRIFEGCNPYGPSENFVSSYRACFRTGTAGQHLFATNSDGPSFLLVDGKLVAQFPGWHGPEASLGQRNGTVHLETGLHRLEYYHLQGGGGTAALAAWQPPGQKYPSLIPDSAFVPVARTTPGPLERADGRRMLDFSWFPSDSLSVQGHALVRYAFECRSEISGPLVWDFGDGATARVEKKNGEPAAGRHLFLSPGPYQVTLKPEQESSLAAVSQTVAVEPLWEQREEFPEPLWDVFRPLLLPRLRDGAVSSRDLANLLPFAGAGAQEDRELLAALAGRAWGLASRIEPELRVQIFFPLGMQLQGLLRDYDGAEKAFVEATREGGAPQARAVAQLHRAGLLIHLFTRYREAFEMLQDLDPLRLPAATETRLRRIYLADALAGLGRREEAVRAYEALADVVPSTDRRYAVQRRGRLLSVQAAIRRGEYDAALQELARLEWETPHERMDDETGLLRVACQLAQADFRRAAATLDRLLKIQAASARVPEMLYLQMQAAQGLKDSACFQTAYARLRKEFPYAAETAWALRLAQK